jgi:hypothetical protein
VTVPGGDPVQAMAVLAAAKGCEISVRKPSRQIRGSHYHVTQLVIFYGLIIIEDL